jgi:hypothetical protein
MPYATVNDVAARLGRDVTDTAEVAQVTALIQDVSTWVDDFCRRSFSDPVPPIVLSVVCAEVMRLLNSVPGISAETVGDVQTDYASSAAGLTASSQRLLKKYRQRFMSVQLETSNEGPCLP